MAFQNLPLNQNVLMDSTKLLMEQEIANAKGIAKINANLEQYHTETMESIQTIQKTQQKLDGMIDDLKLMKMKQDSDTELLTSKSDDIHTTVSFTQKVVIAFNCIITILLLVLCFMTWNEIKDTKVEAKTESIISKYQEILDEYGIEFPEFPEFPEMNLTGTGE